MVSEHCCISYAFPEQIFPPFEGAGLSHMRARVLEPSPHVTEHGDQRIQSDQWPSTSKKWVSMCLINLTLYGIIGNFIYTKKCIVIITCTGRQTTGSRFGRISDTKFSSIRGWRIGTRTTAGLWTRSTGNTTSSPSRPAAPAPVN